MHCAWRLLLPCSHGSCQNESVTRLPQCHISQLQRTIQLRYSKSCNFHFVPWEIIHGAEENVLRRFEIKTQCYLSLLCDNFQPIPQLIYLIHTQISKFLDVLDNIRLTKPISNRNLILKIIFNYIYIYIYLLLKLSNGNSHRVFLKTIIEIINCIYH